MAETTTAPAKARPGRSTNRLAVIVQAEFRNLSSDIQNLREVMDERFDAQKTVFAAQQKPVYARLEVQSRDAAALPEFMDVELKSIDVRQQSVGDRFGRTSRYMVIGLMVPGVILSVPEVFGESSPRR